MVSVLNLTIHLDKEEAGNERLFFKDSGESHLDTNVQLQHNVNFCYEENIKAKVKKCWFTLFVLRTQNGILKSSKRNRSPLEFFFKVVLSSKFSLV